MHSHRSENGLSRNNPARYTFHLSPVLYFFSMSEGSTTSVQTVEVIWVPKRTSFRVNGIKKLVTGSCSILKDCSRGRTRKIPLSITQHSQLTPSRPVLHTCFPNLTFHSQSKLAIQCLHSGRLSCSFTDKRFPPHVISYAGPQCSPPSL